MNAAQVLEVRQKLESLIGRDYVLTESFELEKYSSDETENLSFLPDIVVKPGSVNEISYVLELANKYKIPVTPRGGGTGLSGGALPTEGGIVLSTERMNKILEIDKKNFIVVVEPGVITQTLQETLESEGLFYPVDPASRGSCFIGGNVAENSGGPRAVKYGVTKDYVLGLEVVLPNGDVVNTGSKTLKNATGYNLTQLFVGSEGTLGVVTKIILRVLSIPLYRRVLLAAYNEIDECISSVAELFIAGIVPSALEFLERDAILATERHLGKRFPNNTAGAQLLIELDSHDRELIEKDVEKVYELVSKYGAYEVVLAEEKSKMEELWALRRAVGEAVKSISSYKEEDTVVPRNKLPFLLRGVKEICKEYDVISICYGHAGDGNLHINLLKGSLSDTEWNLKVDKAIREIFALTVSLGGTISGEHGIGYSQKNYLPIALSDKEIQLQKSIKKLFDPNNILNPNKIFP
ncbi:MAG: FAD-binding oxidoreductase [Ignavibacteria bacterium]